MKVLTLSKILIHSTSPDEIKKIHTLLIANHGYQSIEEFTINSLDQVIANKHNDIIFSNTYQLCLSHNFFTERDLATIWNSFPSIWWLTITNNDIKTLSSISYPLALGLLDLTGNDSIQSLESELMNLSSIHLLRLRIGINEEDILFNNHQYNNINTYLASILPNVWVINDDFITYTERINTVASPNKDNKYNYLNYDNTDNTSVVTDTLSADNSNMNRNPIDQYNQWSPLQNNLNIRAQNLLHIMQDCPKEANKLDEFKLDILLEDYYHQVCYYNTYIDISTSMNNGLQSLRNRQAMMPIIDLNLLYFLPHRLQLDLSVVLTTTILFSIPKNLLKDALLILLIQYIPMNEIENIIKLPMYIKTAIVSLLRRIVKKEKIEIETFNGLLPIRDKYLKKSNQEINLKEMQLAFISNYNSNHTNLNYGFYYLRSIKGYLNNAMIELKPSINYTYFSEIEIEILNKLPDTPNHAILQQFQGKYPEWVSFAARHTVLLLTKSPSCPPLTKTQTSKRKQDLYTDMLPILRAASMTLNDLDIQALGLGYDGRLLSKRTSISGINHRSQKVFSTNLNKLNDKEINTLSSSIDFFGANILPYGAVLYLYIGLPNASPITSLSWKVNEETIPRNYKMSWRVTKQQVPSVENDLTQDDDHNKDNVFLTAAATATIPAHINHSYASSTSHHYISKHVIESNSRYSINEYVDLNPLPPFEATIPLPRGYSRNKTRHDSFDLQLQSKSNDGDDDIGIHNMPDTLGSSSIFNPTDSLTLLSEPLKDTLFDTTKDIPPERKAVQYPRSLPNSPPASHNPGVKSTPHNPGVVSTSHAPGIVSKINRSLNPISGFSADACWNNQFLLAPPRAVQRVNLVTSKQEDSNSKNYNQWEAIELAPVIIHSTASRVPFEKVLKVFSNDNNESLKYPIDSNIDISEGNHHHNIFNQPPKEDIESMTSHFNRSVNFDDELTTLAMSQDSKSYVSYNKQTIEYTNDNSKVIDIQDLENKLLKEMGTIRNINTLNENNRKLIAKMKGITTSNDKSRHHLKDSSNKNTYRMDDINSIASETFLTDLINTNNNDDNNNEDDDEDDDMNEEGFISEDNKLSNTDNIFDNYIMPDDEDIYEINEKHISDNNNSNNKILRKSISIPAHLHEPPLKELMNSISTLEILKTKQKYPHIYTSNQAVEYGDVGVNGVQLATTWYPLLDKKIYQLGSQSLDQAKVLQKTSKLSNVNSINKDSNIVNIIKQPIKTKLLDNNILEKAPEYIIDEKKQSHLLPSIDYKDKDNALNRDSIELLINEKITNNNVLDDDLINNKYFRSLLKPSQKKKNSQISITKNKTILSSNQFISNILKHNSAYISIPSMIESDNNNKNSNSNIDINNKFLESTMTNQTSGTLNIETPQPISHPPSIEIIPANRTRNIQVLMSSNEIHKNRKKNDLSTFQLSGVSIKGTTSMQFTDHLDDHSIPNHNTNASVTSNSIVSKTSIGNTSTVLSSGNNSATKGLVDILDSYHSSIADSSIDGWEMLSNASNHIDVEDDFKNPTLDKKYDALHSSNPYLLRLQPDEIENNVVTKLQKQKKKEVLFSDTIVQKRQHSMNIKPYTFRYTGQPDQPWKGQNQHKAATHKIQLNRNFKCTLPSLDKSNDI